jgi:hypothetical protein
MMNILPEHKLLISDVRQNGSGPQLMASSLRLWSFRVTGSFEGRLLLARQREKVATPDGRERRGCRIF